MLRYYSYFSIGGYKDLYLGSSIDNDERKYYLPLLPIMMEEGKTDAQTAAKAKELSALPKIELLDADNRYGLPNKAITMISHAAYKVMLRDISGGFQALALREIPSAAEDDNGRHIPFLLLATGEDKDDASQLECLAAYMANHIKSSETALGNIIHYDIETNGYCVELKRLNEWVKQITNLQKQAVVETSNQSLRVKTGIGKYALLLIPEGIAQEYVVHEQQLEDQLPGVVLNTDTALQVDDPESLLRIVKNNAVRRALWIKGLTQKQEIIVIAAVFLVAGLLVGLIF